MQALASSCAKAASWTVDKLSDAVSATGSVDYTNANFLRNYALVFAASTFLVLLLWLWAVVKRAVRGAPLTTAIGEAIGLLWLAVMASAFTPLVLHVLVQAVDGITAGLNGGGKHSDFFGAFSKALEKNGSSGGGGPIMRIVLSIVSVLAAGMVWLEMVIRSALLFIGGALAPVVYGGLVDKQLWGRVRRWAGIMGAVILIKPIVVIVLNMASVLTGGDANSDTANAIVSGLAILAIAVVATILLFKMIPGMGDQMVTARREKNDTAGRDNAVAIAPTEMTVRQGITTHAGRDAGARPPEPAQTSAGGGISAHATREPRSRGPAQRTHTQDIPRQHDRDENP